jgi:hypothetical protein
MSFSIIFSPSWYILFSAFFLGWILLAFARRRNSPKRERKEQILIGVLGSCSLIGMEVFATSTNLWNYTPVNWPIILWPTYFVAILFGYQLLRVVEKAI